MSLQEDKAELFIWLQKAFELELGTIPPYMTALLSIKKPGNRVSAEIIRSVMMEEMLHMTLVGNLISSLGGRVQLGPEQLPSYPLRFDFQGKRFRDRQFDVDLAAFSPANLEIFLAIEQPADWKLGTPDASPKASELEIPGYTIGQFYQEIVDRLASLCQEYGETEVFCGDPACQISETYYWAGGGHPVVISSLASAKEAIGVIVSQGEGADHSIYDDDTLDFEQPEELAHFFRFREIFFKCRYKPGDHPHQAPSGDAFEVDYEAVYPILSNPKASDYAPGSELAELNTSFNQNYTLMLIQLAEAFNGTPKALYTAIMNGMHGLSPIALKMMALPVPGDAAGRHGAPSFSWTRPVNAPLAASVEA